MILPLTACLLALSSPENRWFPADPGRAHAVSQSDCVVLSNRALRVTVARDGSGVIFENLLEKGSKISLYPPSLSGSTGDIKLGRISDWRVDSFGGQIIDNGPLIDPQYQYFDRKNTRIASHGSGGCGLSTVIDNESSGYRFQWSFELRDDSNYIRESLKIFRSAGQSAAGSVSRISLVGFRSPIAAVVGRVPGSPIVAGNIFAGAEHPMAVSTVVNGYAQSSIERKVPISPGHPVTYSAVLGVAPKGQMRRAFQRYVERERAHPYRPFLHYNSWYDLGYFTPYTSDQCVERINTFGQELSVKRGVKLSSFLFDDGWDDYKGVWDFSKDFPNGFLPLKAAAAKYDAGPGVWLSPWGGYGQPHEIRSAAGKAAGYEVDRQGFDLSGPKYYERFHDVTLDFVKNQGINQFKFDGTGSADKQYPGSAFDSDFAAAISLIGDLRAAQPDLFVNLTTGTWPSPFWLMIADSTWRGGYDHSFAGVGPYREQWITYRDGDTYHGVVQRGPLYPINSLMLHGILYAQHAQHLADDPGDDFRNDVWAYFATGTQLQEMYITPSLLTSKNWDDLASAAKWARNNADTLVDTHWIGGDPLKLEVYGHAAWMGGQGIIELRNPSGKPQAYAIDIAKELQLPSGIRGTFDGHTPWTDSRKEAPTKLPIGGSKVVLLKPFEVLVLQGSV